MARDGYQYETNTPAPTRAAAYAVAQAVMFFVVYGGCLSLTATRGDVGRLYSSWELHVPFVPAMIVPYFSIYVLFFAAFFLCRGEHELRGLSLRLGASQLVAAACYVLFPLECGFNRPAIDGVLGAMFRLLDATDRPYNLAPSLHVTTAVILGVLFASRTRGLLRAALAAWFVLIAVSTMLTWQHHLVDVVGGAMLGLACVRIPIRSVTNTTRSREVRRDGVGSRIARPSGFWPAS